MRSGSLCVSLTPDTIDDAFSTNIDGADCVEVRLDYLKNPQEAAGVRWDRLPVPVIATCRGREHGGLFEGSVSEQYRILEDAAANGAGFVDVDYRIARAFEPAQVIASYHDFASTPSDLENLIERVCAADAHIAKIATQVLSWADNRRILDLLQRSWTKPLVAIGMGDMGSITRLAGPARGSFLSYAAAGRQAAPGQLTLAEMLGVYKFRRIRKSTRLIGILGYPLGHSLSPVLHNRAFEAANLDMAYLKFPAPDVDDFFAHARHIGIAGMSVTIPHKVAVIPHMARLTAEATQAGAVNTVRDEDGAWVGDNTDVHGVREALQGAGFNPAGRKVVIMGRGGAAKAAVAALQEAEEVTVLSRDSIAAANQMPCDLLINATPVGMYPRVDEAPVDGRLAAKAVFDMVYNPAVTKLLRSAAQQGKTVIPGTAMFLAQAARQFEVWTGLPAPAEVFETEMSWS